MKQIYRRLCMVLVTGLICAPTFAQDDAPPENDPIAAGQEKFLGNVYGTGQVQGFLDYWNQVTPENAGKWGSVEGTRDQMNWTGLDNAYNLAKNNGLPFRMHVLVWGAQQPRWLEDLEPEEQLEEIIEWMTLVNERYPDIDYLEVVNEPLNDPPNREGHGNYIDALGGDGETGWDWIIESFRLAREIFPASTQLMINEYSVTNTVQSTNNYLEIIELLQERDLIDAIGVQAHAFSTTVPATTTQLTLDMLAETGLPIIATEMDNDGPTDRIHVLNYRKNFTVFWEHPSVVGVTLWGWKPGMWRSEQQAYLVLQDGTERPAMQWLRAYVRGEFEEVTAIEIAVDEDEVEVGSTLQFTATVSPDEPTITAVEWLVEPMNNRAEATITEDGVLTGVSPGRVNVTARAVDGSQVTTTRQIEILEVVTSVALNEQDLRIFPNPVNGGHFMIKGLEENTQIRILDMGGSQVKELFAHEAAIEINMDVAPGVYFVQLRGKSDVISRKIIVN